MFACTWPVPGHHLTVYQQTSNGVDAEGSLDKLPQSRNLYDDSDFSTTEQQQIY